jgi:hypothetical protein
MDEDEMDEQLAECDPDPTDDWPPKMEPDCPPCMDSGYVPGPLGGRRNCAGCNPTRLQYLAGRMRWGLFRLKLRLGLIPGGCDEPPF